MSQDTSDEPQMLAESASSAMLSRDTASRQLGIELDEIRPGYARMSLVVQQWMLQGHAVCHGGIMFALADTAMAFASNSYDVPHLAMNANIDFLRPAHLNQRLTAEAIEGNRSRRLGMYDVIVTNDEGEKVCHFRGRTYGVRGSVTAGPEQ